MHFLIEEYFKEISEFLSTYPIVVSVDINTVKGSEKKGHIKGIAKLIDGSELHFFEFVVTNVVIIKEKYRYHWQKSDGKIINRWDNARHYKEIESFPHHIHDRSEDNVKSSKELEIKEIFDVIIESLGENLK